MKTKVDLIWPMGCTLLTSKPSLGRKDLQVTRCDPPLERPGLRICWPWGAAWKTITRKWERRWAGWGLAGSQVWGQRCETVVWTTASLTNWARGYWNHVQNYFKDFLLREQSSWKESVRRKQPRRGPQYLFFPPETVYRVGRRQGTPRCRGNLKTSFVKNLKTPKR